MKLMKAIKWYSKGLFPEPYTAGIYLFIFVTQYFTLSALQNGVGLFVSVTQLLLIPMVGLMNGLHIIRDDSVTIFELSLLRSWDNIALSKIIVILLSFLPFLILEGVITFYLNISYEFVYILATVVSISVLILFASLMHSFSVSFTSLVIFLFIFPASSISLLDNLQALKITAPVYMSYFGYFFSPMFSYEFFQSGVINVVPINGLLFDSILFFIMILIYFRTFTRTRYKP